MLDDYDARQLSRMRQKISLYERRSIGLPSLVVDLDGLVRALRSVDPATRAAMRSEWGKLEQTLAVLRDRGVQHLDDEASQVVEDALEQLKHLIALLEQGRR